MARWGEFRRGFTDVRLRWVGAGFSVPLVALVICEIWLRSGGIANLPLSRILVNSTDHFTYVDYQLAKIKRAKPSSDRFFFFGGSSVRECLQSVEEVQSRLRTALGRKFEVFHFYSSQQTLGEALAILEQLPDRSGTVLIGMSPSRMSRDREAYRQQLDGERFGVASAELGAFLKPWFPVQPHHYSWLPAAFFRTKHYFQSHHRGLLVGRLPSESISSHLYDGVPPLSDERKFRYFDFFIRDRMFPSFYDNLEFNLKALERVFELAQRKGIRVVLFELPMVPLVRDRFRPVLRRYQPAIRSIAAKFNSEYWEFSWDIKFNNSDFYDLFHLVRPGRAKYQASLVDNIVMAARLDESIN